MARVYRIEFFQLTEYCAVFAAIGTSRPISSYDSALEGNRIGGGVGDRRVTLSACSK